ncbi:hypothetical protein DIS24_g5357 [Lasiodiplodia hormozganensis]|uniref:Mid2 domain-containing protein n=1 Tax=Lasiodiplodia hormozganensis TaxID=869390 RepID=A0AA39YKJ4_9PEZI|nr:hypothetical protein DIS24_g5357 [Lasiodiplodia hormozganensis]
MASWNVFHLGLILFSLVFAVLADDDNLWIYPTEPGPSNNFVANPAFTLGSKQTIEWTTTLNFYSVALFQQQIDLESGIEIETIYQSSRSGSGDRSFKWTVQTYDANRTISPVYFFWINPGSSAGFTSHYFNITKDDTANAVALSSATTSSSTTSQPTTSSTTAATPSSTTSTSITPASTLLTSVRPAGTTVPASTSIPAVFNKSTSGYPDASVIKVALGVGLGLGIPLVLIAGVWIGLKAVQQRRAASLSSRNGDHPNDREATNPQQRGWQMNPLPGGRGTDQKRITPVVEAPYFQRVAEVDGPWLAHGRVYGRVHEAPGDLPPRVELDAGLYRWI